ncbi:MAG: hypothetical protein Q7T55_16490, partial [Solirubrobacteraceae bacterium]|nr:hypothetical protein [Solirubrobacteraceae bacterium]
TTGATGNTGTGGAIVDPATGKTAGAKKGDEKAAVGTTPAAGDVSTEGQPIDGTTPGAAVAGAGGDPAAPADKPLAEAVTEGAGDGAGNTRIAGVGILGALSLAGFVLLSGNFARRGVLGLKS